MIKKISTILVAAFFLMTVSPCFAAESDAYINDSSNVYIVKLKESAPDTVTLMAESELSEISEEAGLYHASSISEIRELGESVEYYEPDGTVTLAGLPNDPYVTEQWSIESLKAEYAWDNGYSGDGVRIAVIDSGVNLSHEDFAETSFETGFNVLDGSHDVTDENGHGTFVCGVLGAVRNNAIGVAGFCTDATIIPIKCFGKSTQTSASAIIRAIYEAVDAYSCDVINLSLDTYTDMSSMRDAVEHATEMGVIVIAAVGNDGTPKLTYPASYENAIGVGAIDKTGYVASFSQKNQSVYVVAPGVEIRGVYYDSNSSYRVWSGTSFSAPYVAAAAVILKQYAPAATVEDFKEILQVSSVDGGAVGYDTSYGYGMLNLENFVNVMETTVEPGSGDFTDIDGHWAKQDINYCVRQKLFSGVSETSFEPETIMNRAMFVTVLSRMTDEEIATYINSFTDVPEDEWYTQASAWGAVNGIVTGVGEGLFDPMGAVTREQMAVFLYRFAIFNSLTDGQTDPSMLTSFADSDDVSDWAATAMAWAVSSGLITGRDSNELCPKDSAKRCEVATIITRFFKTFDF